MKTALSEFAAYVQYLAETELVGYTYRIVEDKNDAMDIVREVMEFALEREEEFDPSAGPEGLREWLRTLCRKSAKTYVPLACEEESPVFGDEARYYAHYDDKPEQQWQAESALLLYRICRPLLTPLQLECFEAMLAGEKQHDD